MEQSYGYFEDNFFILIGENEEWISIKRIKEYYAHYQYFKIIGKYVIWGNNFDYSTTAFVGSNICAQNNYICFYPITIHDNSGKMEFCIVFPNNPTQKQLEKFIEVYTELEELMKFSGLSVSVSYFERPSSNAYLDYSEYKCGLENLKAFVQQKLKLVREQGEER